uniref:ribonuclease H n=1 Tax=Corvus moneduloides TaxID=1196302 RepID=A0A8U7N725_CORMO
MSQWGTKIDITPRHQNFPLQATGAECQPQKLTWKTDEPVWVNQWSLKKENLEALKTLVAEQLAKGNIVPTNSPWNTPMFVIQKPGKNKYRLLQDLREINKVIEDMGPLQPGMPSPSMLPQHWHLAVLDIKDCFFHIPLHPADAPRFAFSVPSLNRETPMERYHWLVLPQGMKNSPTLCQEYIAKILSPIRAKAEKAIILHYMDDVLVCAPNNQYLEQTLNMVIEALEAKGFELQPEKMQRTSPWKYLGLKITETSITPTPVTINNNPKTLEEVQQICGTLKYLRSWLGLTTEDVAPIANLVKGEGGPASPRSLTEEARQSLKKIQELISTRQAHRYQPSLPFKLVILGKVPRFHGLIFQWDKEQKEPLIIIEWVFLPLQPPKTITQPQELMAKIIMKGRARLRTLAGCDFACIYLPVTTDALDHLLQNNINLQFALDSFSGQISNHYPKHDMFNLPFSFIPREIQSRKPLDAITVFTDASGKSKKSVVTWKNPKTQKWESDIKVIQGSPQVAELAAVVRAFERFKEPFNLVTDSAYVAGVTVRAEHALLKEISNKKIYDLLSKLIYLVSHREHPYFVMHVRSHTNLPGFIAEGNRRADALAMPADIVSISRLTKAPPSF